MIPVFEGRNREERRQMLRQLSRGNAAFPPHLVDMPRELWPQTPASWEKQIRVMRSREFLLQIFDAGGRVVRLSINRTTIDETTWRWADGISWDELQRLKAEAGYGDREAVEIYPPDHDVVNVGNLRHLWVLPERMPFSWGRDR